VREDIRQKLAELRRSVVRVLADLHLLEKKANRLRDEAEAWRLRAISALKSGDEKLAREALRKKESILEMERRYREQLDEHRLNAMKLKDDLKRLEARAKVLEFAPSTVSLDVPPAFKEYDRLVSRIEELEAQVEAMMEVKGG